MKSFSSNLSYVDDMFFTEPATSEQQTDWPDIPLKQPQPPVQHQLKD